MKKRRAVWGIWCHVPRHRGEWARDIHGEPHEFQHRASALAKVFEYRSVRIWRDYGYRYTTRVFAWLG